VTKNSKLFLNIFLQIIAFLPFTFEMVAENQKTNEKVKMSEKI
jgi:hypothetical protein